MAGKLITFEGINASGKTAVCRKVYDMLRASGIKTIFATEPTSTWLGNVAERTLNVDIEPFAEALLFIADHANFVPQIKKWLESDFVVVCDRYSDSTYAYQGVLLRKALAERNINSVQWLINLEKPFTITPDLTFLLVIDPSAAMDRIFYRERTKFETIEFLREVQKAYLALAEKEPRYRKIDAAQEVDAIAEECVKELEKLLGVKIG